MHTSFCFGAFHRGADVLREQIARQEQERLLNDERKDQETQQMLKYLQRLQEEDMEAVRKKKEKQAEIMVEVGKANEVCYICVCSVLLA